MLMDTVKKKLGYMVRSERERRGLSQSRLAEQAGVSTRTISDIETCNGNPELATLIPIAQFLNISIDAAVQDERKEILSRDFSSRISLSAFSLFFNFRASSCIIN